MSPISQLPSNLKLIVPDLSELLKICSSPLLGVEYVKMIALSPIATNIEGHTTLVAYPCELEKPGSSSVDKIIKTIGEKLGSQHTMPIKMVYALLKDRSTMPDMDVSPQIIVTRFENVSTDELKISLHLRSTQRGEISQYWISTIGTQNEIVPTEVVPNSPHLAISFGVGQAIAISGGHSVNLPMPGLWLTKKDDLWSYDQIRNIKADEVERFLFEVQNIMKDEEINLEVLSDFVSVSP